MGNDNQVVLVTGTSSGLGAAISNALLEKRWKVIGISRRSVDLGSSLYTHIQLDLADIQQLAEIARNALVPTLTDQKWHRVGLVNNAGTVGALRPLEDIDYPGWERAFAVNAIAPIYLMGLFVRETPAATVLRIVNISTGAAVQPFPGLSDYGSSKAALRHAGMTLAAELESAEHPGGPRLNASIMSYSPGVVDTSMQETARSTGHPWFKIFEGLHAQGQLNPPEMPARDVVEFLAGNSKELFVEKRFGTTS
jgi:benzil reductase ((S)-benzoin forming)